jgi:hypothetical protein
MKIGMGAKWLILDDFSRPGRGQSCSERREIGTFLGIDWRDYLGTMSRSFLVSAEQS